MYQANLRKLCNIQVDRFENRGKLEAVDVWIQCNLAGLDSILDDNDGEISHINTTDCEVRVWLEGTETKRPQQFYLKEIPREKLQSFFVQRG